MIDFSPLQLLGTRFCLDTETALVPLCFKPRQVRLIQFHSDAAECCFDATPFEDADWQELARFFARTDLEIYGQSLNFDVRVLAANGVFIRGRLFDTYVASNLLYNGHAKMSHSLAEIAKRELGRTVDKTLQATGGATSWMEGPLTPERLQYAMGDVRITWEAAHVLHEKIAAQGLSAAYELECAIIPAVAQMEQAGIFLDGEAISETIEHYSAEADASRQCYLETLDGRLQDAGVPGLPREADGSFNTRTKSSGSVRLGTKVLAGFNINSAQQNLSYWKPLSIEPVDDAKKPTTDRKILAKYQSDEIVRMFLYYKRVEKRLGMAQKLTEHQDEDGRIRARFMPLTTGTGRFSSSGPNLQQVPRDPEFRCAFRAPAGRVLVQADYSAMELRVAAAIAYEEAMLDAFNAGADIHTRSAALMFGVEEQAVTKLQRQQAKALNFGALYGSGAKGVQQYFAAIGMFIGERQARELLQQWHQAYPAFGRWHRDCQRLADAGEPVRTRIGRRRKLFGTDNRLTTQANSVVQGTSADIMKAALVEIHRQLPPKAMLLATIHDEFLIECDEVDGEAVLALTLREMEQAAVPILGTVIRITAEGAVLQSWGDK